VSVSQKELEGPEMDYSTMEELVEQRVADLRNERFTDLLALPECKEELVKLGGKDVQLFTLHDVVKDKHRFVLQATRQSWGGIAAKVVARGFEVADDKEIRVLTPEELYDFT
jgi:hypothetical protein